LHSPFAATPTTALHKGPPVNLIFSNVHPSNAPVALGPFNVIRITVAGMRAGANDSILTRYHKHQWEVDGASYFRLDCTAPVAVHFERSADRSNKYGPYKRFSAVNGLAYGDDKVIAFMDHKSDEWLYYDSGYHWPTIVISKAAA
jgi:hypothetical protein